MSSNSATNPIGPQRGPCDVPIALGLFAMVVAMGCLRLAPGVCGVFHDDAIYVDSAASLARGEGYRLPHVPGEPRQTKYPVFYPALLAIVWRACPSFPQNLGAMQGISLATAGAYVAIGYLYLVRRGYSSRSVALASAALVGTSSSALYFASTTMAEMPFALLIVLGLWRLDCFLNPSASPTRYGSPGQTEPAQASLTPGSPMPGSLTQGDPMRVGPPSASRASRRAAWTTGLVVALPSLCRTSGAPLVPMALYLTWRGGQRLRWVAAGATCVVLPWVAWSLLGRGDFERNQITGYYTDYLGCWGTTGWEMLLNVVHVNALSAARGTAMLAFEGACALAGPTLYGGVPTLLLSALGVAAWGRVVSQSARLQALPAFLVAYLALLLVWSWPPFRFLIPTQLFLTAFLLDALRQATTRFTSPFDLRWFWPGIVGLLLAANLWLLVDHAKYTHASGYPLVRRGDTTVAWDDYVRLFDWLRQNSQSDDVVASGLDSMIALYADRTAFRPFVYRPGPLFYGDASQEALTSDDLTRVLSVAQPRFLVEAPMSGFAEGGAFAAAVQETALKYPQWIREVYRGDDKRFAVYELDASKRPPASAP